MAASLRNHMKRLFCQSKRLTSSNPSAGVSLFKRECSVQAQEDSNLPSIDTIPQVVDPLQHQDYFDVRKLVDLETLFKNRVHFGHHKGSRDAHMVPYIFGSRFEYDMINLDKTLPLFQDALNFVAHVAYRNGIILFISRNKIIMPNVEQVARDVKEFAHCRFWRDGLFTDSSNMFKNVTRLPDLCIFLNTLDNVFEPHPAILECSKLLIPTVGIVDTNCDPRLISYPIPGNDDTIQTQLYYLNLFKKAVLIGKKKQVEDGIEVDDRDITELLEQTNMEEEIVGDEGLEMDSADADELGEELQTGEVVNDQTGSDSASSTDEQNINNSRL